MDASQRTPSWLIGLIVIFALAAAATFGLFLYRHAEKAALNEQFTHMNEEVLDLRTMKGALEAMNGPLDQQIATRKQLVANLDASDKQTIEDVNRLVTLNQQDVKTIQDLIDKELATYMEHLKDGKERRVELGQEETRAQTNERDFDDRRQQLRAKIENLSQDIEQVRKKGRKDNAELDTRVGILEDRVRELTQQRELNSTEIKSDGEILQADASNGFVVINRGHVQHLRKGTRFAIFNRRAGKNIIKGAVEVIRVEEQISVCRVLSERDGNDPFVPKDQIANPVYDPDKIKVFVVRGDFRNFSKDELRRFIEESGGQFSPDMSVNTDYLVAGERSEEALRQANKLGISILSEDQLIESQLFRLPTGAQK